MVTRSMPAPQRLPANERRKSCQVIGFDNSACTHRFSNILRSASPESLPPLLTYTVLTFPPLPTIAMSRLLSFWLTRSVSSIREILGLLPLPRTTVTAPMGMSTSVQLRATTSERRKPLSAMNSTIALSRTLHARATVCNGSAVSRGSRFLAIFGISKWSTSGMYFSTCQKRSRVFIARAWACFIRSAFPSIPARYARTTRRHFCRLCYALRFSPCQRKTPAVFL